MTENEFQMVAEEVSGACTAPFFINFSGLKARGFLGTSLDDLPAGRAFACFHPGKCVLALQSELFRVNSLPSPPSLIGWGSGKASIENLPPPDTSQQSGGVTEISVTGAEWAPIFLGSEAQQCVLYQARYDDDHFPSVYKPIREASRYRKELYAALSLLPTNAERYQFLDQAKSDDAYWQAHTIRNELRKK